jgi:hypothetical protein
MLQQAQQLAATEEAGMVHSAVQASLQDGPGQGQWGGGDVEDQLLQAALREQEERERRGRGDRQQQEDEYQAMLSEEQYMQQQEQQQEQPEQQQAHRSDSGDGGKLAQRQQGQPSRKRPRND